MPFTGRTSELAALETRYAENTLQIVLLTGTGGIGKTALFRQFTRRKPVFYFSVRPGNAALNHAFFLTDTAVPSEKSLEGTADWTELLERICQSALRDEIVLAIDDAAYLEKYFPDLLPALAKCLAGHDARSRLFLLFLSNDARLASLPAFKALIKKRRFTKLALPPLSYLETADFLADMPPEDRLLLYGATGGRPGLLSMIDPHLSAKENLYRLFFDESAPLLTAPLREIDAHFREPAVYHTILHTASAGILRQSELALACGMPCSSLSRYLDVLLREGTLARITPITESAAGRSKKSAYLSGDTHLAFWYRFVFPHLGRISAGKGKSILRTAVLPNISAYCGDVFRRVCLQYGAHLLAEHAFGPDCSRIGYWWHNAEDLSAPKLLACGKDSACLIACLWETRKTGDADLAALQSFADQLPFRSSSYLLFSRKGFTDHLTARSAHDPHLRLISLQYLR